MNSPITLIDVLQGYNLPSGVLIVGSLFAGANKQIINKGKKLLAGTVR